MDVSTVEGEVMHFLVNECGAPPELCREDKLFSTSTLDSLDIVSLISFVEQRFAVSIPALEVNFESMDTPARISQLVMRYQSG